MKFEQIKAYKKILIYGYGLEGKSSERFLKLRFPHLQIDIFDANKEGEAFVVSPDLEVYDFIVVSPGVPRQKFENISTTLTSNTEIFFHNLSSEKRKKVLGVTGSKGKSTTSKFLKTFLQIARIKVGLAGNIGVPLLDLFDDFAKDELEYLVAELSSFQLENLDVSPGISVFLNIFPDHLDRHGDLPRYFGVKANIFVHQEMGDFLVFPEGMVPILNSSTLSDKGIRLVVSESLSVDLFPENSIWRAEHFRSNLGVVRTVGQILKLPNIENLITQTAGKFTGLAHRLEFVAEKGGVRFYNDSIAVNPEAAIAAVKFFGMSLGGIILGGISGGGPLESLLRVIQREAPEAQVLLLDSPLTDLVREAAGVVDFSKEKIIDCENLEIAVRDSLERISAGKSCVLSPAGKSFDMFKNFEERGNQFKALVNSL
jgi:UDP-N-acetylmuramoylalanine--D-glutamate ligase